MTAFTRPIHCPRCGRLPLSAHFVGGTLEEIHCLLCGTVTPALAPEQNAMLLAEGRKRRYRKPMTPGPCGEPDCRDTAEKAGLCLRHYQRERRARRG